MADEYSRRSYRRMLDGLPQLVWSADAAGQVDFFNKRWVEYTGVAPESHFGDGWVTALHADDRERCKDFWRQALNDHQPYGLEYRLRRHDGAYRWFDARALPLLDARGRVARWIGASTDFEDAREPRSHGSSSDHERRPALQALARSREELRAYVQHVDAAIEQERAHIARELHDELGQRLTALKLDLRWLSAHRRAEDDDPGRWADRAATMMALIDDTIQEVRALSSTLRPQAIEMLGLAAAIKDYCSQFHTRSGIRCVTDLQQERRVPGVHKLAVFRVFQEAMTNVARHSGATTVTVRLYCQDDSLHLEVEDDGCGLGSPDGVREHLGLIGMNERARHLHGNLDIRSLAGCGALVALTLPVPPRSADR